MPQGADSGGSGLSACDAQAGAGGFLEILLDTRRAAAVFPDASQITAAWPLRDGGVHRRPGREGRRPAG